MATANSLNRLIDVYRNKNIMGEKGIDPEKMVRNRCRHCKKCRGAGCPEVRADLPVFQRWIRIDRFIGEYMRELAKLAKKASSPDEDLPIKFAEKLGMNDILKDCRKAILEQEVRFQGLIRKATAALGATSDDDAKKTAREEARNELLLDTYRWLRSQVSTQIAGGNWATLEGKVQSGSIMNRWTIKFMTTIETIELTPQGWIRKVRRGKHTEKLEESLKLEESFPPAQLIGNFLNLMCSRKQFTLKELVREIRRLRATSIHEGGSDVTEDTVQDLPDDAPDLDEELINAEFRENLLKRLTPFRKWIYKLRFEEECTINEMITKTRMAQATISRAIATIKKIVIAMLEKEDRAC